MTQPPESPTPRPSPERRFIQRQIVQPLIQWAPLGGSSWLFVSFLLKQEWAQVFLAFPVTVVTAVWAAYSKNFVERLSEIYAEKGKRDADALNTWLSSLNEALKWQFSGFERKYLKCQAEDCRRDKTEGYNPLGISKAELTEVFVPLRISARFGNRLGKGHTITLAPEVEDLVIAQEDEEAKQGGSRYQIWDFLSQVRRVPAYQRMTIIADGGSGKTTLLRHIAHAYATGKAPRKAPRLIPVLLYLRDLQDQFATPPIPPLAQLIMDRHLPKLPQFHALEPPPAWAEKLLRGDNTLVMLDGFDEVEEQRRPAVSEWITAQMSRYPRTVFLLTSRPTGYEDYTAERPETHLTVNPFNDEERNDFIHKWYLSQERLSSGGKLTSDIQTDALRQADQLIQEIDQRQELAKMATNPLLLKMIATFHYHYSGQELPRYPAELYSNICKLQLIDRPKARRIPIPLHDKHRQQVLQVLALAMVEQELKQIDQTPLLDLIRPAMGKLDETADPEIFLRQVVRVCELLVERKPSVYEFAHLNFRDYLAATQIYDIHDEQRLLQHFTDDHWRTTILLYAGQFEVNGLVQSACQIGTVPVLAMAWKCVQVCPYPVPTALRQALQSTQYLESFLQKQQWKEADKETYRLMIQAVGKEYGDCFEPEELQTFPCEELRAIDGLWVKHSNGRFGFSVQKQIYVECGATLDGKYPGDKIWEKFGDRVGWRKDGNWLYYEDLNPSLSSPQGIFPGGRLSGGGVGFCVVGGLILASWFLFSRTQACRL